MALPTSPYLHGQDGSIKVAGDGTTFVELDSTNCSGNVFQKESHVFTPFNGGGWKRVVAGNQGGQIQITAKARSDQDIRAAERNIIEGNLLPIQIKEPGYAVPHEGNMMILNVEPKMVSNAEFEYTITGHSDGEWTRGTQTAP